MKAGASSMWASCCGLLNEVMGTGTMRPPGGQAGFGAGARPFRFAPGAGYSTYPPATPSSSTSSAPISASANAGLACKACGLAFSVFRRKHVCSDCRKSFCSLCSVLQENLRRCATCHLLWGTAFQRPQLMRLRVKDLRQYLTLRNIPTDTCREKEDLVELVLCTLGPRPSRIGEEVEEEEEEEVELERMEAREEEVVAVLGCGEEDKEQVKKKEREERKEGEGQEERENKEACEEEVHAAEEEVHEEVHEEVDRGEEERPEMLLTPPQGSAPRSVSENSELSITASQDDTLSSSDSTGTSSQDQADAASLSILNLDDSSSIQEASPGTQRRARASLSDIANEDAIESLTVRQLKEILARNFVNFSGCCEKWELVERVHRLYRESEQNRRSMENVSNDITTDGVVRPQLSTADENLCRICMDAFIDCVLLECGHMVTCTKCGKRMSECPICRQYVVRAVHVFKS